MKNKNKQTKELPFGDLVAATYQVWGKGLAAKMVRWAIKTRFAVFHAPPHFLGSPVKGSAV